MVKEAKVKAVEALSIKLDEAACIGVIDMHKMPSRQLQKIMKELRGKADVKMVKKSILIFAMDKSKKEGIKKLKEFVSSQPAIVMTQMGPFNFYSLLSRLKFPIFAKDGDLVEQEVKVSAGPTSLLPGPVISEFQKVGIPASIQDGKIAIRTDKVVLRKGERVSADLAGIFRKLNIQPVTIGLTVVAMLENDLIYSKEALEMVNEFPVQLPIAYNNAINLSVAIAYPTKKNITILIAKAAKEAKALKALAPKTNETATVETPASAEIPAVNAEKTAMTAENKGG